MSGFPQDLRYAMRQLRKSPGFTAIAVLTLALGIGANTAIFSVVNAALLHALPYKDPDRLVYLWSAEKARGIPQSTVSIPDLHDWREQNQVFDGIAAFSESRFNLTADDVIFRYPDSQRISLVVRSPLDAGSVATELNDSVAWLDSTIPVQTTTLARAVYRLAERPRFNASLLLLFAVIGVLLAAAGIYGLVSLLVSQRTQEIAIHIALGANPSAVARKMVLQACRWIALGATAGIVCALAVARWVNALLFGIKPNDPATLAEAALALLALGVIAAYIPARRAAKVDPMVALRYE